MPRETSITHCPHYAQKEQTVQSRGLSSPMFLLGGVVFILCSHFSTGPISLFEGYEEGSIRSDGRLFLRYFLRFSAD